MHISCAKYYYIVKKYSPISFLTIKETEYKTNVLKIKMSYTLLWTNNSNFSSLPPINFRGIRLRCFAKVCIQSYKVFVFCSLFVFVLYLYPRNPQNLILNDKILNTQ